MNLARLLQLASPALPVGAYSYSGGLEAAIEAGTVKDAKTAEQWIRDVMEFSVSRMELPLLKKMLDTPVELANLNEIFLASRETAELRAETVASPVVPEQPTMVKRAWPGSDAKLLRQPGPRGGTPSAAEG